MARRLVVGGVVPALEQARTAARTVAHLGDPRFDTADVAGTAPGSLRADYVLPSKNLRIDAAAVFWPLSDDPLFPLGGTFHFTSSHHRSD